MQIRLFMILFSCLFLMFSACSGRPQTAAPSDTGSTENAPSGSETATEGAPEKGQIWVEYKTYETAEELVGKADLIIEGTVVSYEYQRIDTRIDGKDPQGGLPYTVYTVQLDQIYRGHMTEDHGETLPYKLICLGGTVDGVDYEVLLDQGEPVPIEEGKKYLFLCNSYPEKDYETLVNLTQAVFDLDDPKEALNGISLEDVTEAIQNAGDANLISVSYFCG